MDYRSYTKAELQVQLRALMRGGPGRLPISSMKKHELEAYIDSIKELKANKASKFGQLYGEQTEFAEKAVEEAKHRPVSKGGHLPPRPVPTATIEVDGEETITVPGQPPVRMIKAPPVNKPRKPKAPKPEPEESPEKSVKAVSIKEEPARPLKEKSVAKVYCTCNCPSCPHK